MTDWNDEYRAKMREFMAEHGRKVTFEKRWEWDEDDAVSTYGWCDYDAERHIKPYDKKEPLVDG